MITLRLCSACLALAATSATAQEPSPIVFSAPAPMAPTAAGRPAIVPFGVGERLEYDVKFGFLHVGNGSMEVTKVEPVRGHDAYHTVFRIRGGTFFFKVNDRYESWIDTHSLSSLRHLQDINEGGYHPRRKFEIYPDRQVFTEDQKPEQPTVSNPLDDGSFLYFIRTVPLEVGKSYEFDRYFKPDKNPVTIKVLRREQIDVPAGKFTAVVLQPVIKTSGIFSENGDAQIWISDDDRHIMLMMKSKLSFGSLNLYLKSIHPAPAPAATSH
ncbi:MAG: DUF3108 domain-containing protein [Gemmatimonadaceae bacterium]